MSVPDDLPLVMNGGTTRQLLSEIQFLGVASDLLLTISSFLSAYGDERGMAEDACEAWRQLESRVVFTLMRAPSLVCRTCVPLVSGQRTDIKVRFCTCFNSNL